MSAWESVGSTYVEAATSALPLHRLVVFGGGVLGSVAVSNQTHLSIFETIARLKLSELASLGSSTLTRATLADLLVGVVLVACGWALSRILLWVVFAAAAKSTDLWARVHAATERARVRAFDPISDRQAAVSLIDSSLEEPRMRLRVFNMFAELLCGLALGFLLASWWGNVVDVVVAASLALLAVVLYGLAVRLFLAEYFGPALFRAQLQGRKPPSPLRPR